LVIWYVFFLSLKTWPSGLGSLLASKTSFVARILMVPPMGMACWAFKAMFWTTCALWFSSKSHSCRFSGISRSPDTLEPLKASPVVSLMTCAKEPVFRVGAPPLANVKSCLVRSFARENTFMAASRWPHRLFVGTTVQTRHFDGGENPEQQVSIASSMGRVEGLTTNPSYGSPPAMRAV
jgi:hypothetical protein